jgi:excisionase family DNA binding protein
MVMKHSNVEEEWLTVSEASRVLRVGETCMRMMIKRGEIPIRRTGRLVRVPAWAVRAEPAAGPCKEPPADPGN